MVNPYLTPPQVESAESRSWAQGFLYGFQGPSQSTTPRNEIGTEDADAFDAGVLGGQDAAINGLAFDPTCVDLNAEAPETFSQIAETHGFMGGMTLLDVFKAGYFKIVGDAAMAAKCTAGAIFGGIVDFVLISISLETFSDNPDEAIAQIGGKLQGLLQALGYDQGMQLFIGGGIDTSEAAAHCELQLTPIFRDQASATNAAKAMGRPNWLVATWDTNANQCGGISVVDQG
jgi:hypothetical protein